MSSPPRRSDDTETGIDFLSVSRLLWEYRRMIVLICAAMTLTALAYALNATPIYRAEVVVVAAPEQGLAAAASGLASQFGGLASLAGVNLTEGGQNEQAAQAVLVSNYLATEFIKRYDLLPQLSQDSNRPLTQWRAAQKFKKTLLTVFKDVRKGVTTVSVEWKDAATAAKWANGYVALANESLRNHALEESSRNIRYLNGQIAHTNDVELRRVLYDIVESETKTLMLANGRLEYGFQVVDPAVAPEIRAHPRRTLLVLGGAALGLFLGWTAAFFRDALARNLRRSGQRGLGPVGRAEV